MVQKTQRIAEFFCTVVENAKIKLKKYYTQGSKERINQD